MFVVRTIYKFHNESTSTHKAELSKHGRHTGESPAALLVPRIGIVRSDRPLLFTLNLFIMRTKKQSTQRIPTLQVSYDPDPLPQHRVKLKCAMDAYRAIWQVWDKHLLHIQEQFGALFLDAHNRVIGFRILYTGTDKACLTDGRYVTAIALQVLAASVIIVHNHPSGLLKFTPSDISTTKQIRRALDVFNIQLVDHILITADGFTSFENNYPTLNYKK